MIMEDCRARRGEPVIITIGKHVLKGTIEWGDDPHWYSVMTEPGGARFIVQHTNITPDPGGVRPLWSKRHPKRA